MTDTAPDLRAVTQFQLEGARAQNRAGDEALVLPGGYVEVIATKA